MAQHLAGSTSHRLFSRNQPLGLTELWTSSSVLSPMMVVTVMRSGRGGSIASISASFTAHVSSLSLSAATLPPYQVPEQLLVFFFYIL